MIKKALLTAVVLAISSTLARAGWEYSATTKSEGDAQNSQMMNSTIKGYADGEKSRVEFISGGNPMTPAGSYMISKDGGKTMLLVNPKEKKYAKWDLAAMMGSAGGMMEMMGMKFSTPKVEKLLDEKGEELAGLPTKHTRFRTSYTMEMNFMGIKQSTETLTEEDIWSTDRLKDVGLGMWLNQQKAQTGNEQLDKMMKAEMDKVSGFPLKRMMTSTSTSSDGKITVTKMTAEVTAVKKADIAASQFELPAGYEETQMSPMVGAGGPSSVGAKTNSLGGQKGAPAKDNPFLKMMQEMNKGK
jgi:hypothetical protein